MEKHIINGLIKIVGDENVKTSMSSRHHYGHDASYHDNCPPDIVVFPNNIDQVSLILKYAQKHSVYVTPFGSGTGLEGNAIPVKGGVVISLQNMNKIIDLDSKNFTLRAEAGVSLVEIDQALKPLGLWIPTFPGTLDPTLGGIISTNASGKWSTLYGQTGDYVLELDVVLMDGSVIHLGRPVWKTVAGYDLKSLFIGSEGTLGIIVQATMRLLPRREGTTMVAYFEDLQDALNAVENLQQEGLNLSILEFADTLTTELMLDLGSPLAKKSNILLIEIHHLLGKSDDQRITLIEAICKENRSFLFEKELSRFSEREIWRCRDQASTIITSKYVGRIDHNGEVVVPITKFTEFVMYAHELSRKHNVPILTWGHAGQGNLHTSVMGKLDSKIELELAQFINDELIRWALRNGGTSTGEHGIGLSKTEHLINEHPTAVPYMKQIKMLFDPKNLLNPGKKLPDD